MEYCNRGVLTDESLKNYFPNYFNNQIFRFKLLQQLAKQLVHAIQFCHDNGVLHRDSKNSNCCITQRGASI